MHKYIYSYVKINAMYRLLCRHVVYIVCGLWFVVFSRILGGVWFVVCGFLQESCWYVVCGLWFVVFYRSPGGMWIVDAKPQTTNHIPPRLLEKTTNHKPHTTETSRKNHKPQTTNHHPHDIGNTNHQRHPIVSDSLEKNHKPQTTSHNRCGCQEYRGAAIPSHPYIYIYICIYLYVYIRSHFG